MRTRLNLTGEALEEHLHYERTLPSSIRRFVLERDNNQCRRCCGEDFLDCHHVKLRAHGRDHRPSNLITLCSKCHRLLHDGVVWVHMKDGDAFFGGSRLDLYDPVRLEEPIPDLILGGRTLRRDKANDKADHKH
jgi:hypothetical protein